MDDDANLILPDEVTSRRIPTRSPLLGGLDMGSLLSMAGDMQKQMAQAQEQAAHTEVEGSAGGGAVRVTMTGTRRQRRDHRT